MTSGNPSSKGRRSLKGILVCLAMFIVGGLMLWGLFRAPRPEPSPKAPPDVPAGVPPAALRFVSYDAGGDIAATEAAAAAIAALHPDFVMLQNVTSEQVLAFARALGMQASFHPHLFQRVGPAAEKAAPGCLLLGKHPLYDAGPVSSAAGTAFGVRAQSVVAGRRFMVASVDPPAVSGGPTDEDGVIRVAGGGGGIPVIVGGVRAGGGAADVVVTGGDWVGVTRETREGLTPERPIELLTVGAPAAK